MLFDPTPKPAKGESHAPASKGALPGRPARRLVLRLLALAALILIGWHAWIFAEVWWLRGHDPRTTAFMERGLERLRQSNPSARLQQRWVPYERIANDLKRAVIAGEDQRFLEHSGFDLHAIGEAIDRNERRGNVRHGGSTISQQLAKNLFLSPRRTWPRKAEEAVITVMIETALPKRRILEIYLNVIEWGNGIYGAEAAAQHYFGRPAFDLSPDEAAHLAAMIPSPRSYTHNPSTPYLDERTEFLEEALERVRIP
ncbi:MAG TPA: monofunctional biosynthetic peptidoglycan transglycosylase [Dongiaceae bacterium]|nr:monofunctional biosynthetic peptidoglycan transglycosylase [Dongiaceae bacterium]